MDEEQVPYTPNQRHRHDRTTYVPNETIHVGRSLAHYFVMAGWGSSPEVLVPGHTVPPHGPSELDIHSTQHGTSDSNG